MQTGAQVADQAVQGILSRIDQLAVKLGTTAANVWSIYVAQAKIEAIRDTVIGGGFLLISILLFILSGLGEDEDVKVWSFVFAVAFLVGCGFWFYPAIGEWLNPQYWAFQHLTTDLKNLL